jgi:hypothetical protein
MFFNPRLRYGSSFSLNAVDCESLHFASIVGDNCISTFTPKPQRPPIEGVPECYDEVAVTIATMDLAAF